MSDDGFDNGGDEFDDAVDNAIDASDLFDDDRWNIDDYYDDYGGLDDYYHAAADLAPGDLSEGQIGAFLDMLDSLSEEEWQDAIDEMLADFWEWWGENYGEN